MEISQIFGQDLTVNEKGGLTLVDSLDETNQRVMRRLLSAVRGYIWHLDYGAGLPQFVGDVRSNSKLGKIKSLVVSNVLKEETVAKTPTPTVKFDIIADGIACTINYKSSINDKSYVLTFTVNN